MDAWWQKSMFGFIFIVKKHKHVEDASVASHPAVASHPVLRYCWLPPLAAEKLASRKPLSLAEESRLAVSTTGHISHLVSLSYERTFRNFRKGTTFNNKATEATSSFLFYACCDAAKLKYSMFYAQSSVCLFLQKFAFISIPVGHWTVTYRD